MIKILGLAKEEKITAPVGTQEFLKEIKDKYQDVISDVKILSDDLYDSVCRYDEISDTMSKLKVEKDIIEHTIMAQMQAYDTAYIKERKVTWKKSSRISIDSKRLKEEEAHIYEKYSRMSSSRVFKIK